jgi:hypothetical protein
VGEPDQFMLVSPEQFLRQSINFIFGVLYALCPFEKKEQESAFLCD